MSAVGEPLFLILSGSYVGPELVSEFGLLPPCFLPHGLKRLFEDQIAFARTLSSRTAILLPDSFVEDWPHETALDAEDIAVIRGQEGASLSAGLAKALRELNHDGRLFLLFGDTLVDYADGISRPDTFASGSTRHLAKWADFVQTGDGVEFHECLQPNGHAREVVAGFFDFADGRLLQLLAEKESDFIAVLNAYSSQRGLRAVRALRWLDFGHLHTYYWSRRVGLASRDFNRIDGDGLTVRKSGTPARKIYAEAAWFQNLPVRLRPFVPHFIDLYQDPDLTYELEYLHLPLLSELYCFARLPSSIWFNIIASCRDFLEACQAVRPRAFDSPPDYHRRFFDDMFVGKTAARLDAFSAATGVPLNEPWTFNGAPLPSLNAIIEALTALIEPTSPGDICFWHGDFHFANILFDFRSQRVRVIDPRGMLSDGTVTVFGDARYDISKLTHSIVGLYDLILTGRYALDYEGGTRMALRFDLAPEREQLIQEYRSHRIGRYACGDAQMIGMTALLFLSMLPLHADDVRRQTALLGNGLRLAQMAIEHA